MEEGGICESAQISRAMAWDVEPQLFANNRPISPQSSTCLPAGTVSLTARALHLAHRCVFLESSNWIKFKCLKMRLHIKFQFPATFKKPEDSTRQHSRSQMATFGWSDSSSRQPVPTFSSLPRSPPLPTVSQTCSPLYSFSDPRSFWTGHLYIYTKKYIFIQQAS